MLGGTLVGSQPTSHRWSKHLQLIEPFWLLQIAGWLGLSIGTFPVKMLLLGSWQAATLVTLTREGLGFLLTLGLRRIYRRYWAVVDGHAARQVLLLSCGALLAALADFVVVWNAGLGSDPVGVMDQGAFLLLSFGYRMMIFGMWGLLYFGIKAARTRAREARELRNAELRMLRAQINPHFLFNALNTVQAGIGGNPEMLDGLVQSLAGYLRYTLKYRKSALVPLGDEYAAVLDYLAIEQARFRDALVVETLFQPGLESRPVPGVILQPLLENAIRYGRQTSARPLRLRMTIARWGEEQVEICVANTGHWVPQRKVEEDDVGGVGLENLRQRLDLVYPGQALLTTEECDGWVMVRVLIPANPRG